MMENNKGPNTGDEVLGAQKIWQSDSFTHRVDWVGENVDKILELTSLDQLKQLLDNFQFALNENIPEVDITSARRELHSKLDYLMKQVSYDDLDQSGVCIKVVQIYKTLSELDKQGFEYVLNKEYSNVLKTVYRSLNDSWCNNPDEFLNKLFFDREDVNWWDGLSAETMGADREILKSVFGKMSEVTQLEYYDNFNRYKTDPNFIQSLSQSLYNIPKNYQNDIIKAFMKKVKFGDFDSFEDLHGEERFGISKILVQWKDRKEAIEFFESIVSGFLKGFWPLYKLWSRAICRLWNDFDEDLYYYMFCSKMRYSSI